MEEFPFPEKITSFLRDKLAALRATSGSESSSYRGLALQYLAGPHEGEGSLEKNLKHYEAGVAVGDMSSAVPGVERLYKKSIVIEPTLLCLAHCRYCLRSNYDKHTLTERQLVDIAKYCGHGANRENLNEVLITGGDPLIIPQRLEVLLNALLEFAPNIKIVRIGTRLPSQDPHRIDDNIIRLFKNKPSLRFEIATQINHPVEMFPEVVGAYRMLAALGVRLYSQNVLLKGVNDDIEVLIDIYNLMRENNIEAHYLFHCVPMIGIHHLRTSVGRGLALAKELTGSGRISGRAKPVYAAMTDVGKIIFYEDSILKSEGGRLLLQSQYRYQERVSWNPSWQLPCSADIDPDGFLRVWYVDGEDSDLGPSTGARLSGRGR